MAFYTLTKSERENLVAKIQKELKDDIIKEADGHVLQYFADEDTYIRKAAYLSIGRIYFSEPKLQDKVVGLLEPLLDHENFKVRQTAINAAGEIGKKHFDVVKTFFNKGLLDPHHAPRNAVIGSIKKMVAVNPVPVLKWAETYLHHPDKEIRRQICHGIELRGRQHPEDIMPLLQQLQFDKTARVRNTLVHVIGQIAYKKGCLEKVIQHLKEWENKDLVKDALEEIIDVHHRYSEFAAMSQSEAKNYIQSAIVV